VWADAKPDGSPPNNWQSVFGGPAWTWDARRCQYYLHNFLPEQPDLNVHNPAVQDALLEVARFWLDRGVDGFRIDAINFAMHDPALRDNPPAKNGGKRSRPFDFQQHIYNQSHPDIVKFLERLRKLTDSRGGRFMLAEVGGDHALSEMHAFTAGNERLNSAYGFDFLYADRLTPKLAASVAHNWPDDAGWPTWAFENHDAPRAISRWANEADHELVARLKVLLLCALRGSIILYQGEELGMSQVDVPFDQLQDPEAITNWPHTLSRDGARTPMPWSNQGTYLGFSRVRPWLPLGANHEAMTVARQLADAHSILNFTRACLDFRKAHPALRRGSMEIHEAGEQLLVFDRVEEGEHLRCSFNLSASSVVRRDPEGRRLIAVGDAFGSQLAAWSAVIEQLA
jgi:alpha-glucosidase